MTSKKIQLDIIGLSESQTQGNSYVLILGDQKSSKKLPIIIGPYEAQAIALELENIEPTRPLTHDLFKHIFKAFKLQLNEVIIYKLHDGIFYSKLVCEDHSGIIEIEARTSDAVAIAVRFNASIKTFAFILDTAGVIIQESKEGKLIANDASIIEPSNTNEYANLLNDELEFLLAKLLKNENYELASKVRDEINRRKTS